MDIDDPIQQLLTNTGWSCDDLLEKLQKYKSQKENKEDQGESLTETDNKKFNHPLGHDATKDVKENNSSDVPTVSCNEKTNKNKSLEKSVTVLGEEFSDTDEEEVEVNVTNSNIINEIIDDIASVDNAEELNHTIENTNHESQRSNNEEQEEITEVRVIELNEDEEDDCFEEECSYNIAKHDTLLPNCKNVEYLETFPRKAPLALKPIDLTENDDKDDISNEKNNSEEKDKQEDIFFNNEDSIEKLTYEENSKTFNTTNTKKLDICEEDIISSIEYPNDDKTSRGADEENTNKKIDEKITTIIYEKNYEKMLNSTIKTKDSESICEKLGNTENVHIYPPISKRNDQEHGDLVEEQSTLTNLEDIRNNLKLQLNSLRTRKKGHFLQNLSSKFVDSSECDKEKFKKANFDSKDTTSGIANKDKKEHDLYTQTNEFGLVILSVQGGIDLEGQNNENKQTSNIVNEDSSNTINSALDNSMDSNSLVSQNNLGNKETNEVCGVFDEIRKIIRKQKQNNSESDNRNIPNRKFNCFARSTDILSSESKEESNEKTDYPTTSAENSQSSFTNDDTGQNIDKNSPFVSNTLDEFLTENSKLNISYNVPKSGAEEGLVDSYREKSPLMLKKIVKVDNEQVLVSKKTEKIKAKTVAQKRKLLEKQWLKELKKQTKTNQKPLINDANHSNTLVNGRCSYIEINNTRLWVRGTKPNVCIAKIKSPKNVGPPLKQCHRKRKLSLLNELVKKYSEEIKYLPGPLSKKSTLQVNGHDNWITETKLLPKITLEVIPKIGQCLPPNIIHRLPQCDGVITADLAEFALSVLKTKINTSWEEKTFQFPVTYMNNQEKIVVKKQKLPPLNYNREEKISKDSSTDNVVANVIDDLIRYVEIKEIAPTLIKEEKTGYNCNDEKLDKMPVIAENISSIIKKPQKKKSKVELELLRLNCKVVNVEVEENFTEESCSKPYCQLGCVCKSLKCDGIMTYHCQNVGCMLECRCPKEKSNEYDKLMLPAGTDILSKDAVTRIEDEAKKDLAKVEREFTQMVIHTNDKTIVVGTGGRHKTRRCTKAPIKYSDYIDSNFERIETDDKAKTQDEKRITKECFVRLEKLSLQDIMPYCMFHNSYNCPCEGKSLTNAVSKTVAPIVFSKSSSEEIPEKKPIPEKKYPKNVKITPPKQPRTQKEALNNPDIIINQNFTDIKMSASGRPIRINKKLKEGYTFSGELDFQLSGSARTLGIPFCMGTKRKHSMKSLNKLIKEDFYNNITQSDIFKAKFFENSSETLEVDILKQQLVLESELHKKSVSLLIENALTESKHKRKQVLEVRNDDIIPKPSFGENLAIQRRKKPTVITRRDPIKNPIESVFDGEIIVDERNMELLQKMGNRTVLEGYARLLPWTALINSFNKRDIKIWCMIDQPSRLLINKGDKMPPKNYIDIRQTTQTTEVILWITTNKLPQRYHKEHVSFILKQTKDNYEICGLCTKNPNDPNSTNDVDNEKEFSTNKTEKDSLLFKHKDLNGVQQLLYFSKGRFKLQELVEENLAAVGETSVEKNKLYMWAALPEIYRMCKWRMIFLNSDFTFLYFTKVKYSIKYTDLLSASNKAKEANCTVILRNSVICHPYDHSAFGIYFDAHYQDRLFIGPYFKQHKDDDVETLRYINQSLVCTESFNKMQGKTNYKCGHWLIERPYSRPTERRTIDLTQDTSFAKGLKRKKNGNFPQIVKKLKCSTKVNEEIVITQNNDCIKVLDSEPRKPEEFNRYIITNIPHLGYLGAFQHDNSPEIDVSWPFENKMLRFPTVSSATEFLQCRFSSLLQPVPETFKVHIIVLTHIDLETTKPIDVSILSGHYICGEFGCYNVKTITNEFCINIIGTTREELLRIFARRAQKFVRQKVEELAYIVNISQSEERHDIVTILNKTQKDIESLTQIEKQYIAEKNFLLLRKRELAAKVLYHISFLPEHQKSGESWKFRQILKKQPILMPQTVMEPIEIPDSDDEEEKSICSKNDPSTQHNVENSIHTSSEAIIFDKNLMDDNCELSALSPKLNPVKVPSSNQSVLLKPPDKVSQTAVVTYPPQRKLKSILKSNIASASPTPTVSRVEWFSQNVDKPSGPSKRQYLTGVKLIKTSQGKFVLVSDDQSVSGKPCKFKSAGGKQLVIKNSQILSVKSINPIKKDCLQNVSMSEKSLKKVSNSPPKTIILKKSALFPQILNTDNKVATSLFHNKLNEKSLLKTSLTVPEILSIKDPSNEEIEQQTRIKDTTEICKHMEMIKVNNSFLENPNRSESTEIIAPICNTTDIFVTSSEDNAEETLSGINETICLKGKKIIDEKNKLEETSSVENCHKFLHQTVTMTETDNIKHASIKMPPTKPPDIEFNEQNNDNESEIICNTDVILKETESSFLHKTSILKNEETVYQFSHIKDDVREKSDLAERDETMLKSNENVPSFNDTNVVKKNSISKNATFGTLENNTIKDSKVIKLVESDVPHDIGNNMKNVIINEKSSNRIENNDVTTENPFLANVVSEIFLSKTESEMSSQINLTNAAALTQIKNAANDNFNLCLLSKEIEKSYSPKENFIENNEQNSFESIITSTTKDLFGTDGKITSKTYVDNVFQVNKKETCLEHSKEQKFYSNSSSTNEDTSTVICNTQFNNESSAITLNKNNNEDCPSSLSINKQNRKTNNMDKQNNNSVESYSENSINNKNDCHKMDDKTLVQIKYDVFKNSYKEELFPTVVDKDSTYDVTKSEIDEKIISSISESVPDKSDSKTQTSNGKEDFKDSTNVKISKQVDQQISTQNIETKTQLISNLVNHEALVKICSDAIENEYAKTNVEAVKKVNVSVSVTLSTKDHQNSSEGNTTESSSAVMSDRNFSEMKCSSNRIELKMSPKKTTAKKLIRKHDHRIKNKFHPLKNINMENLAKNNMHIGNTKKMLTKFYNSSRQMLMTNDIFLKRYHLLKRLKLKQRKPNIARKIICKSQTDKNKKISQSQKYKKIICEKPSLPISDEITQNNFLEMETKQTSKNYMLCNESILKPEETEISTIKNECNIDTPSKVLSDKISEQIDYKLESQISSAKSNLKTRKKVIRRKKTVIRNKNIPIFYIKHIIKSKCHKESNMPVTNNTCNILQTNSKTVCTSVPLSHTNVIDGQLSLNTTVDNESLMSKSEERSNEMNPDVFSNEHNNKQVFSMNPDTTILSTFIAKNFLSKRISNIVIHTFPAQHSASNSECSKENTEPNSNVEISVIENDIKNFVSFEADKSNINSKVCTSKSLSTDHKNVTNTVKKNNHHIEDKTKNTSVSKKTTFKKTIKCINAKVNNIFTIDKGSFSKKSKNTSQSIDCIQKPKTSTFNSNVTLKLLQKLQKSDRKDNPRERGRIRKEIISTSDLICASKILKTEKKDSNNKDIVSKICALTGNAMKVRHVKIINKETFLKNAQLAEKVIDIGNMKKKLHANICEDNSCKSSM